MRFFADNLLSALAGIAGIITISYFLFVRIEVQQFTSFYVGLFATLSVFALGGVIQLYKAGKEKRISLGEIAAYSLIVIILGLSAGLIAGVVLVAIMNGSGFGPECTGFTRYC